MYDGQYESMSGQTCVQGLEIVGKFEGLGGTAQQEMEEAQRVMEIYANLLAIIEEWSKQRIEGNRGKMLKYLCTLTTLLLPGVVCSFENVKAAAG